MTVLLGDTGKVAYGTFKQFDFTYPAPYEHFYATPNTLGTTQPGTATESYTIPSSLFPTITPSPYSVQYNAVVHFGGKNLNASASTFSYQLNKNGSSILSASNVSITASNFFTYQMISAPLNNPVTGDTLDLYLWNPSGSLNYDYFAITIYCSRINLSKAQIVKDVNYTLAQKGVLTQGNPSVVFNGAWYMYPTSDVNQNFNVPSGTSTTINGVTFNPNNHSYYFGRCQYTEITILNNASTSATVRPSYNSNTMPTKITFREVLR